MLFHELDDYTMTEAMKWYPKLKENFDVRVRFTVCFSVLMHFILWLGKNSTSYPLASLTILPAHTSKTALPSPTSSNVCYIHAKTFPGRSC
jgi:hypothetical protein